MKTHPALLALLLIAASGAQSSAHSESMRKCAPGTPVLFPNAQDWVYLLDGKPTTSEAFERTDKGTFESVQMLCANDAHRVFGVESRLGAVVTFTAPGPSAALGSTVERIQKLQEEHLARTGAFARDLAALGWSDASGMIRVDVEVAENGSSWQARVTHRYLLPPLSRLALGSKP